MPTKKKSICIDCGKSCTFKAKRCKNCANIGELNNNFKEIKLTRSEIDKRQLIKKPWLYAYKNAKQRCTNPKNPRYKDYGERDIEFRMTLDDFEFLWFRDKAYLMDKPSIDREDNDGHYELSNCQFIEMDINRIKDRLKPILQYDLDGNFIKEWNSITDACQALNFDNSNMVKVLKKKFKTSGKFIWRYKNG